MCPETFAIDGDAGLPPATLPRRDGRIQLFEIQIKQWDVEYEEYTGERQAAMNLHPPPGGHGGDCVPSRAGTVGGRGQFREKVKHADERDFLSFGGERKK